MPTLSKISTFLMLSVPKIQLTVAANDTLVYSQRVLKKYNPFFTIIFICWNPAYVPGLFSSWLFFSSLSYDICSVSDPFHFDTDSDSRIRIVNNGSGSVFVSGSCLISRKLFSYFFFQLKLIRLQKMFFFVIHVQVKQV